MKKFFIGFLYVVGIVYFLGLTILVARLSNSDSLLKPVGDVNGIPFTRIDVSTSTQALTTGSKQVLATSTSAQWRIFQNIGPSAIYLNFSDAPATINSGIMLLASSTFEVRNESMYQGAVQAIAVGANSGLLINQK